jgi:UDP-N-acetylglucosamine 4,6-dehydratase (inverting)
MQINEKSSILVTGGTGSFGKKFVELILQKFPNIQRLVIYSRDELKQFEMSQHFSASKHSGLRYFIGDIRDVRRLTRACEGIDIVVHAAALKQVPAAEYNPIEFIRTNVLGSENVIEAALDSGVKRVVALSTDKAAAPINLYGATKLCADKLFVAANNIKGRRELHFSVVRYGNVMGSRGSVIPFFLQKRHEGVLPITDPQMTRFNITLNEGVNMVIWAIENGLGGEIFVPRIPSYHITDVATAIAPNCEQRIVGIRAGEKVHEEMITTSDSFTTVDCGEYYAILPVQGDLIDHYCASGAKMVETGFSYNSGQNKQFLTVEELRNLIKVHVDPNFAI